MLKTKKKINTHRGGRFSPLRKIREKYRKWKGKKVKTINPLYNSSKHLPSIYNHFDSYRNSYGPRKSVLFSQTQRPDPLTVLKSRQRAPTVFRSPNVNNENFRERVNTIMVGPSRQFISPPPLSAATRRRNTLFVNQQIVRSRLPTVVRTGTVARTPRQFRTMTMTRV